MFDATTLILLAASAPPLLCALLLLALDCRRPRRPGAPLLALLWGAAVAATAAAPVNDWLLAGLVKEGGEVWGHAVGARAGAPVVEELLKGLGVVLLLVLRPDAVRTVRDGALLGAMVGLGFEVVENRHYLTLAAVQAGPAGLLRGLWVRGVLGGLKHAVFTAITGAGIGWARQAPPGRARVFVPLGAFAAAVVQHGIWNAVASQAITDALCGAPAPGGACLPAPTSDALCVSVPLIVALCIAPGFVGLLVALRRSARSRSAPA